ncbi:hypothetical protein [Coxiella-like endosymbiont of Rhipicephalus sanguineus]|uniref:hypothetical protein n=1 Tax=Coxiella-like endosymbiont of Rhipicephalus sanguineus TaxID=1955402 RepID=UPI0027DF433F|nr:hypothetical protein [Coxiella-like endosymbiont of Rhipicephalus sanguineus]
MVAFVQQLIKRGIEIIASGGTENLLREHQILIIDVSAYTGFPEFGRSCKNITSQNSR